MNARTRGKMWQNSPPPHESTSPPARSIASHKGSADRTRSSAVATSISSTAHTSATISRHVPAGRSASESRSTVKRYARPAASVLIEPRCMLCLADHPRAAVMLSSATGPWDRSGHCRKVAMRCRPVAGTSGGGSGLRSRVLPLCLARWPGLAGERARLVCAACSRMTCTMVGGLRSSWSSRKASGWTASSPSGPSAAEGKSRVFAVTMACAPPCSAAATTCRSSRSGRLIPPSSPSHPVTSASSNVSRMSANRLQASAALACRLDRDQSWSFCAPRRPKDGFDDGGVSL
jgi:hypothetical protein